MLGLPWMVWTIPTTALWPSQTLELVVQLWTASQLPNFSVPMSKQQQYWKCCVFTFFSYQFSGVGLILNSTTLTNNSIVTNTEIGTGATVLVCTTIYRPCCFSSNPETQWYFPNGSQVPNNPNLPYRRTRGRFPGRVNLIRNSESTTTGIFHCDIPDASGELQSLYVGVYTSTTGESSTLSEWLVICKEISSTPDKESIFQVFVYTFKYTIL